MNEWKAIAADSMPAVGEEIEVKRPSSDSPYDSCGSTWHRYVVLYGYPEGVVWRPRGTKCTCTAKPVQP
jgi:hypothetical protein